MKNSGENVTSVMSLPDCFGSTEYGSPEIKMPTGVCAFFGASRSTGRKQRLRRIGLTFFLWGENHVPNTAFGEALQW